MFCIFSGKKQGYIYEAGDDDTFQLSGDKKGYNVSSRLGQTYKAITMTCWTHPFIRNAS